MKRLVAVGFVLAVPAFLIALVVVGNGRGARVVESHGVKTILAPKGFPKISIGTGFTGALVTNHIGCVALDMGDEGNDIAVWPHNATLTTEPTVVHFRAHDFQINDTPDSQVGGFTIAASIVRTKWGIDTSRCGAGTYVFLE